jgi:cytochrome c6
MKKLVLIFLAVAVVALIAAPGFAADDAAKVFAAKCAVCHGPDGAGKLKGTPDLRAADVQNLSDQQLFDAIAKGPKGKEATHAFEKKGLDEAAIKGLVAYVRGLKK